MDGRSEIREGMEGVREEEGWKQKWKRAEMSEG
jgi:hypothetical protein